MNMNTLNENLYTQNDTMKKSDSILKTIETVTIITLRYWGRLGVK